ncbi:MAG: hypothetical protein PHS92_02095 [Candidatus Gracilibacteria bacterium]|nr:hypothetical protein [Candidatus Gracilibacteria bacterium]
MQIFGITTTAGNHVFNFASQMGDISEYTYGLYFGDIILLIMCFTLLLALLGMGFKASDFSSSPASTEEKRLSNQASYKARIEAKYK